MAEKHRYERNIGPRLDDLESKFNLLSERLSRIEAQLGGASRPVEAEPTRPATTAEQVVVQASPRKPIPEVVEPVRPTTSKAEGDKLAPRVEPVPHFERAKQKRRAFSTSCRESQTNGGPCVLISE